MAFLMIMAVQTSAFTITVGKCGVSEALEESTRLTLHIFVYTTPADVHRLVKYS